MSGIERVPTPSVILQAAVVEGNLRRMAEYCDSHRLGLRPHSKTHKSRRLAAMQRAAGAIGLTVAKVGEAEVMAGVFDDMLLGYPVVDLARAQRVAKLAQRLTIRVAVDSRQAVESLADAARSASATIGVLVDLDVGLGRTGVQSPADALALAELIDMAEGLRLDGLFFYPGQIISRAGDVPAGAARKTLAGVSSRLGETLDLWKRGGLSAAVVSGGSTPTAYDSHEIAHITEIRPGTYIFNDMNTVHGGYCSLDDCAARVLTTVVSTAVPGQVILDAGSKTLSADRCWSAPDNGFGHVVEYPQARIVKLSEEHAQVDIRACAAAPRIGQRVTVIPNHVCPCVNLHDSVWWRNRDGSLESLVVDARGRVT